MSQPVSDVYNEAPSTNVSNKDDCDIFLRSLSGGDRALEHAIKQAQYCSRTQARKAAEHVHICVQRNLRMLTASLFSSEERSNAAVALESCVMAVIHKDIFDALAQTHKAEDIALHGFLEQLMDDKFEVCGTSPKLQVQEASLASSSQEQQPSGHDHHDKVPDQVWQLCGVSQALQSAALAPAAEALRQLDSIQCPLEVVTCLQQADQAITQAVGQVRRNNKGVGPLSSDSLLPLFIVALVVAQPVHLHACLAYIRTFHKCGDWAGRTGFQVATLEAAITFLQQLVPGRKMTLSSAYSNPELLRTLSMDHSKSGTVMLDPESLHSAIAKQHHAQDTQRGESQTQHVSGQPTSLLDVESELPLTFALDTQLPTLSAAKSNISWTRQITNFFMSAL